MALVKAFIPDKWGASAAQPAPVCSATSLNFTAVCEGDGGFDAIPPPVPQVHAYWTPTCQPDGFAMLL